MFDHDDLLRRALAAYFRHQDVTTQPAPSASTVEEFAGTRYVVLRNNYDVLAVYRVRVVGGTTMLRFCKRLASEVKAAIY